jgi:hypothetical protein
LLLKDLDNELVGDDSATFAISDSLSDWTPTSDAPPGENNPAVSSDAETERINQLLEHIGSLEGAVFIRNGEEHSPAEADEHLRRKWKAAGDQIATAEQFIDELAAESSLSGEPYVIRLPDGKETPSGEYLRQRLAEMDKP